MPIRLRAAYGSLRNNRTRVRNTWTLAEMESTFLKDIGISRVEIYFSVLASDNSRSAQQAFKELNAGG